jgi:hypothetical protein
LKGSSLKIKWPDVLLSMQKRAQWVASFQNLEEPNNERKKNLLLTLVPYRKKSTKNRPKIGRYVDRHFAIYIEFSENRFLVDYGHFTTVPWFYKKIDSTCKSNVLVLFHVNRPAITAINCNPIYILVDFWGDFFSVWYQCNNILGNLGDSGLGYIDRKFPDFGEIFCPHPLLYLGIPTSSSFSIK